MSLAVLKSRALAGMEAAEATVEVHLANGLPSVTIVGLAVTKVKEASERVRAACKTLVSVFPPGASLSILPPPIFPKSQGGTICLLRSAFWRPPARCQTVSSTYLNSPVSYLCRESCGQYGDIGHDLRDTLQQKLREVARIHAAWC